MRRHSRRLHPQCLHPRRTDSPRWRSHSLARHPIRTRNRRSHRCSRLRRHPLLQCPVHRTHILHPHRSTLSRSDRSIRRYLRRLRWYPPLAPLLHNRGRSRIDSPRHRRPSRIRSSHSSMARRRCSRPCPNPQRLGKGLPLRKCPNTMIVRGRGRRPPQFGRRRAQGRSPPRQRWPATVRTQRESTSCLQVLPGKPDLSE